MKRLARLAATIAASKWFVAISGWGIWYTSSVYYDRLCKKNESLENAVTRELEEEIGVSPVYWFDKNSKNWSSLPIIFGEKLEKIPVPDGKETHFHRDFIFVAIIDYRLEEIFVGESAGRIKWFTLEDISNLDHAETTPETLELIK